MSKCNHTFHRLGGIEDCPVCNPQTPAKLPRTWFINFGKRVVDNGEVFVCQSPSCNSKDIYVEVVEKSYAALEALRGVPGEFDSDACDRALEAKGYTETNSFFAGRYAARWQFERDKERIALAEARIAELESALELGMKRIKKMNHEIETCRLQYPECGISPSTVFAEMDLNKMRQALKRDGGSDAQE